MLIEGGGEKGNLGRSGFLVNGGGWYYQALNNLINSIDS